MKGKKNIVYVDGHEFVSEQTKQIEKRFKCSRPKPSNEGCGFKGRNGKKKAWVERMLGIGK